MDYNIVSQEELEKKISRRGFVASATLAVGTVALFTTAETFTGGASKASTIINQTLETDKFILNSEKNSAYGVATLDKNKKIAVGNLPEFITAKNNPPTKEPESVYPVYVNGLDGSLYAWSESDNTWINATYTPAKRVLLTPNDNFKSDNLEERIDEINQKIAAIPGANNQPLEGLESPKYSSKSLLASDENGNITTYYKLPDSPPKNGEVLYFYNNKLQWIDAGLLSAVGASNLVTTKISSNYQMSPVDQFVRADTNTNNIIITLENVTEGRKILFKNTGSKTLFITAKNSENIDGSETLLVYPYNSVTLIGDNDNKTWYVF